MKLKLLLVFSVFVAELAPIFLVAGTGFSPSDEELILALSSENSETATSALEAIFKAGDRMIPLLVSFKGNGNLYWGYNLGHPASQDLIFFPDKKGAAMTHVTLEVAALYLLEALYRKDLAFAQSPYLTDRSVDKPKRKIRNSDEAIRRAWSSVEQWLLLAKTDGIESLREKKINPLFKSKTSFWGS